MENLNAKQVKSDLAICALGDCQACHYNKFIAGCRDELCGDALALITSQEQRIKELTDENERMKNSITFQVVMPDEKMEEIKAECLERVELDVKECRADTVRKMQERLIVEIEQTPNANEHFIKAWKSRIDQIAKEMLEGEK